MKNLDEEARRYARLMVERESRGNGDQINALERVARRCHMSARALRRLIIGETKDPSIRVFAAVRAAYLDGLARQIAELQSELAVETAKSANFDISSIQRELEALTERVEAVRKGTQA
ncbi:hypothetical protein [Shinella zoogloeoides]